MKSKIGSTDKSRAASYPNCKKAISPNGCVPSPIQVTDLSILSLDSELSVNEYSGRIVDSVLAHFVHFVNQPITLVVFSHQVEMYCIIIFNSILNSVLII